jgi:Protein of unknown function (DUF3455)
MTKNNAYNLRTFATRFAAMGSTSALILCLLTSLCAGLSHASETSDIPEVLAVPNNQRLVLELIGKGVQIYKCSEGTDHNYEWKFEAPDACLFDQQGKIIGRHFAGPTWQLNAGDKLVGRVKQKYESQDKSAIPWLLLETVESSGKTFGQVKSVQRVNTDRGKPPAEATAANLGEKRRILYSATYKFYAVAP